MAPRGRIPDGREGAGPKASPLPTSLTLPEPPEELPDVRHQQVGRVLGGPVGPARVVIPGDDVVVVPLGEAPQRLEVEGEAGQAGGDGGGPAGLAAVLVLVVGPVGGGGGVGQP